MRAPKHAVLVRVTHWVTAVCLLGLVVSGVNLVISHPRFYWGEEGNVNTPALFQLPIPASRGTVPTGYGYVLPDQNGWSRGLHFELAWVLVGCGVAYWAYGWMKGHFRGRLWSEDVYNRWQKVTYLGVVLALFPALVWTGAAMSPAVRSVLPGLADWVGGHQSARTLHFFLAVGALAFAVGHVGMVVKGGFWRLVKPMIWQERNAE